MDQPGDQRTRGSSRPEQERRTVDREVEVRHQLPRALGVDPGEILESISDAFFALDSEWAFIYLNAQGERLLARPREALIGRVIWEEFPEAVDSPFWDNYHRAIAEQVTVAFEAWYEPLHAWFAVRAYPVPSGLAVYFEDITARREIERRVRELEERFRQVQEGSPDSFLLLESVRDAEGHVADFRFMYLNPAAEAFLGITDTEMRGRSLRTEMPNTVREGRFDIYVRVVESGVPWRREFRYSRKGVESVLRATATKVGDGLAVSFTDVTERVRAEEVVRASERRERFLAEVTRILASTLDYDRTVEAAARLSVPEVSDLCIVDLFDEGHELRRAVIAHVDPDLERTLVKSVGTRPAEAGNPNSAIARAIALREPVFIEELPDDVAAQVTDEGVRELLELIRPLALIAVPLMVHGEPLGALQLIMGHASGRRFTADDVNLAQEFARRAASAIDNARHYRAAVAARTEAEQANAAKSQFLATMSHELRTPLNAILGYAELLDIGVAGSLSDPQRDYLHRVRQSGRHLLALINDILDLSKVEAGQMTVRRDPIPLLESLQPAVTFVRPQAAARGLELSEKAECGPDACAVGDEARVRQIVTNLLANAVKFTEPGGRVEVTCGTSSTAPGTRVTRERHAHAAWAYIRVTDSGIGIPETMHERIFEPFVQVESGHTRTQGGTGLGLAISRRLARLMHGDLTVESKPGEGSTFTLWLPVSGETRAEREGAPPARRPRAPEANLRLAIGAVIRERLDEIIAEFVRRMRVDPALRVAHKLPETDLQDHYATFIIDMGQQLAILDSRAPVRHRMIADGGAIQQAISERHGAQRQRLGFTEQDLKCEYQLLREVIDHVVREQLGDQRGLEDELGLLRAFLDEAEEISIRGYRDAAAS